ncbi:hypothetical protein [uncultured Desulfovibrio sp.]|uniref:hypothetical protein n=1 Tax=uncultured Desulfovibrio sp. TaxID=167968 RepID=UPI002729DB83|nr:hypothetical protein [uncultured Desulfovibrio sp.]
MSLIADAKGEIRGTFTIPGKVPSGAKAVVFKGAGGSEASASFVGQGTLTVSNVIQAKTITRYWTDPLAQTFALTAPAQVCGVDLWFTARGQSAVRVQIRDTDNGYPGKTVLTETRLAPESLVITGGGHTRALFPAPVSLAADTEYAIVVMCDDAETALAIAALGQFDATRQYFVAGQPYQVGVLFSSSNASAWTPHQEKDLAFRILEADFTAATGELALGGADVTEATDMLVMALEDLPRADTRVEYELTLPGGDVQRVAAGQPVRLARGATGQVLVKACLSGKNGGASPVLWPGTQLLAGTLTQSAVYQPRAVRAVGATRAVLIFEAHLPSGATVTPELRTDAGEWTAMTAEGDTQQGDGWVEFRYGAELADADEARYRLTLAGTSLARPRVRNLKFLTLNA